MVIYFSIWNQIEGSTKSEPTQRPALREQVFERERLNCFSKCFSMFYSLRIYLPQFDPRNVPKKTHQSLKLAETQ